MIDTNKYFDIYKILPYQRSFNLINAIRSVGKTYVIQWWCMDKAIKNHREIVALFRTQNEIDKGILEQWYFKVLQNEFSEYVFKFNKREIWREYEDEKGNIQKDVLVRAFALSEYRTVKKMSMPLVNYIIFDEYIIEDGLISDYYRGWNEPSALLSIYHSIDRDEHRVKVFMMANTSSFYNPYHLDGFFDIPTPTLGKIWTSKEVLFWWVEPSEMLKKEKENDEFFKATLKSLYGKFANTSTYNEDKETFIHDVPFQSIVMCSLIYENEVYTVYNNVPLDGNVYIKDCHDRRSKITYALTLDDHSENTFLVKSQSFSHINFIKKALQCGRLRFDNIKCKKKFDGALKILS